MSTIELGETPFWYDDVGEGPPIVFLHGGFLDSTSWRPQVERFREDHRIVTFDVRGHGRTGKTDQRRYTVPGFADDLHDLLTAIDVERPVICGLSLGSMIAQTYAARYPIRGLALAGALKTMPPVPLPTTYKRAASPTGGLATTLALTGQRATFELLLSGIRAVEGHPWLAIDEEVRERALETVSEISRSEYVKTFDALYRFSPPEIETDAPAALIYGEYEASAVKAQSERLADALDASLTSISDAGHLVNADAPEAFNDVVDDLLARV